MLVTSVTFKYGYSFDPNTITLFNALFILALNVIIMYTGRVIKVRGAVIMALGPNLLKPGSMPSSPVEQLFLATLTLDDLRGAEQAIFTGMHDLLGYEEEQPRFLGGLLPRKSDPTPVESDMTRYKLEAELPHNTVMMAWLQRQPKSRQVALVTQPLEYVGAWLPVGNPLPRTATMNGGRVAIEGFVPEVFENLDPAFQTHALVKTQHVLGFLGLGYDVLDGVTGAPDTREG